MMMGIREKSGFCLRVLVSSRPPISGIMRSVMIKSGRIRDSELNASRAFRLETTSMFSSEANAALTRSLAMGSSSMWRSR